MSLRTALYAWTLLFLMSHLTRAQQSELTHYTTADGLPQNSVNSILEDHKGFIWLSTSNGLARFDGYDFKIWNADFSDTNSLKSNEVMGVVEDTSHRIWICTGDGGLSRYNPETDEWRTYLLDSASSNSPYSNSAFKPRLIGDTALWYLAGWSLQKVLINPEKPRFSHFILETDHDNRFRYGFRDFTFDGNKTLWVASPVGLVAFDLENEEYLLAPGQEHNSMDSSILACEFDQRGDLWVSPFYKPVQIIRRENLVPGARTKPNPYVPSDFGWPILKINQMDNGQMHLLNSQGLYICNNQDAFAVNPVYEPARHLYKRLVWDTYLDNQNNLWIGTDAGLYCDFEASGSFEVIRNPDQRDNTTYRIFMDSKNQLWYGAVNEIQQYHSQTGSFRVLSLNDQPEKDAVLISGILEDEDQNLWIAAFPYLTRIDHLTKQASAIDLRQKMPELVTTLGCFVQDRQGSFWFGHKNGVSTFDPETGEWRSYVHPENTYFTSIDEFNEEELACVSSDHLYLVNKEKLTASMIPWDKTRPKSRKPYLQYAKMVIVHDAYIFIGTKEGLVSYEIDEQSWEYFTIADGLPSNVIRALALDTLGRLWMSTNQGIAWFDIATKHISTFNPQKSMGCVEFNSRSVATDESGIIYFGCNEGVLRIDPAEFTPRKESPTVEFTGLSVFNKKVPVGVKVENPDLPLLTRSLEFTDRLELDHTHSVFTIEFAALNFFEPEKVLYRHRLVGFDTNWLEDGTNRRLTFTNLDPGDYTLEVQASNSFGIWGEETYSLPISIKPPWYNTALARVSYILLGLLALYALFTVRMKAVRQEERIKSRIKSARMQEREDFRRESAADFHDEAGNKITKINLLTELARGEAGDNSNMISYLKGIEQNNKGLSAGMRDFLWVMDPDKDTLFDTIYRLQRFGDSMFDATSVKFNVKGLVSEMQEVKLSMQARKAIMQIFREGTHNCLKHSNAGEVNLQVSLKDSELYISLSDNGEGFDMNSGNRPNHYGLKIMSDRATAVGATLNILSAPGNGCKIEYHASLPHMG
jgi:ligand-binding sensor domain-containing protein/signal transduction histidine kinase